MIIWFEWIKNNIVCVVACLVAMCICDCNEAAAGDRESSRERKKSLEGRSCTRAAMRGDDDYSVFSLDVCMFDVRCVGSRRRCSLVSSSLRGRVIVRNSKNMLIAPLSSLSAVSVDFSICIVRATGIIYRYVWIGAPTTTTTTWSCCTLLLFFVQSR